MTLVYLYFHRTTVQGSSVGVSCRLFLLRLYFAQTHSSLAIAPRPNFGPKSTKLEKKLKVYYLWRLKNPLFSGLQSHGICGAFSLPHDFLWVFENDRGSWVSFKVYLISAGTEDDLFSSLPMAWFWKGQRCKCKDARIGSTCLWIHLWALIYLQFSRNHHLHHYCLLHDPSFSY